MTLQEVDRDALGVITTVFGSTHHIEYQAKGRNGGVVTLAKKSDFDILAKRSIALPGWFY